APGAHGPGMQAIVESGRLVPGWAYAHALEAKRRLSALADEFMAGLDLVILPTVDASAPGRSTTGSARLQEIATFLGLPAVALPSGFGDDGLPLSTQLIGGRGEDVALLMRARSIESLLDLHWRVPPEIGHRPVSE